MAAKCCSSQETQLQIPKALTRSPLSGSLTVAPPNPNSKRIRITDKVDVTLSDGTLARAVVPSGASTGIYEALDLRDGGSDYLGKAVENVNLIIGPTLIGKDPTQQTKLDNFMVQELDGTLNEWGWCKQKHIANLAGNKTLVLPVPAFNVINGGSHAGSKLAMQEFMILPVGAASFKEAMKMGVEVYHNLKSVIKKKYGQDATNVGDEGGYAPNIQENKEGLELLKTAIAKAGYTGKVIFVSTCEYFVKLQMCCIVS
ncbi:hypothetical protein R6Q57_002528 [Mikania cordata]